LLIDRELRSKLHEAFDLIYSNLEDDDVDQWAYRVRRLSELGLAEESNQLENMLILLTTGEPRSCRANLCKLLKSTSAPDMPRLTRIVTALLLLCMSMLSVAQTLTENEVDPQLKALLMQTVSQADSFHDRFDAEVWLLDMSTRLTRFIPNEKHRLDFLRLVHREARIAGLKTRSG